MNFCFNGLRAGSGNVIALAVSFLCSFFNVLPDAYCSILNVWLECPPNVTIGCETPISNLDYWGKIWVWEDNVKKPGPVPSEVLYNLNSCGMGEIIRKWTYEDKNWKVHSCSQTITVNGSANLFSNADITWPLNYQVEGCSATIDPKDLPKPYNYPVFLRKSCSQPMYSYQDSKFTIAEGCMKILRTWKVIDWCQFVPNAKNPVGIWTYTQVIKIIAKDSLAHLVCPKDTVILSVTDCQGAYVKLDSVFGLNKCGNITKITNNSPYSKLKNADASGYYPIGTTKFYYFGEYGCGSQLSCEISITVKNKVSPVPNCLPGLIVALMPVDSTHDGVPDDGMIVVWAKDIDHGSYAKCQKQGLIYSFSSDTKNTSRIFTCADLGKNEVQLWITDSSGNQSFCKTYIEIQNNNAKIPNCKKDSVIGNPTRLNIAGNILSPTGTQMPGIQAHLIDQSSFVITEKRDTQIKISFDTIVRPSGTVFFVQKKDTSIKITYDTVKAIITTTHDADEHGHYSFNNLVKGKNYKVIPGSSEAPGCGLDINDAIILLRFLLGVDPMNTPYQRIAADINADGTINTLDFNLLYAIIKGEKSIAEINQPWRCCPAKYDLSRPYELKDYIAFTPLTEDAKNTDFIMFAAGDLDLSCKFENLTATGRSVKNNVTLLSEVSKIEAGIPTNISLRIAKEHIQVLQASKLSSGIQTEFKGNNWRILKESNTMYAVNTEQEGPQLIELKIESPTSFNIEELPAKIGLTANLELQVEIINPERIKEFNILNVYPSPQIPGAPVNVQISSSSDESVLFYLQDVQGNIQIKLQVDLKKGINMISIPIEEATPSGIYILKCVNHKDQIAKRIIISK
ncbi:MAG: T9SS type A sorting domain-containing protein [Saprospiraceae bacterium]